MGNFGSCHAQSGEQSCTQRVRRKWLVQALVVINLTAATSAKLGGAWALPSTTSSSPSSHSSSRFRLTGYRRKAGPTPVLVSSQRQSPGQPMPDAMPVALGRKVWSTADAFLELLVYTTLWMSFSLASLVPFVQLECGMKIDGRPFWAAASESIAVYTLDHLRDISKATKSTGEHKMIFRQGCFHRRLFLLRALLAVSILALASSLLAARSWIVSLTFIGHVLLCAAYAKLKPRMPYCKAFYVSICVVFMAVAAPCAYAPTLLSSLGGATFWQLLLLIFSVALTVEQLQDIRDVDEDLEAQVVTLASGLGQRRARQLLLLFQAASLSLHILIMQRAHLPLRPHFLAVHVACGLCSMGFTSETPRSLFQVLLEPLYALPLLATVLRASTGFSL
ncbi:unnamed protein product [Cladocopium goreaui]|uniref:Uncharacterized protein n=1 Tax=Cladocopium goreaui TaxID=2562237 RepID=A0A9P1BR40_9DINO|nr:unnamed protein product [Cladocopium goreaui]